MDFGRGATDLQGNNPLISVILPCYNSENTLRWTVNSVLRQTYKNFELICVDDASVDGTYEILLQLASEDSRVRIIRNDVNSGLGPTRNNGISAASGEYLAFIDDDDFYEIDFLSILLSCLRETGADLAQCGIRYIYKDGNKVYGSPAGIISGEHCRYRIDSFDGLPYLTPQAWNKLYKRSLFDVALYKAICYEDAEVLPAVLRSCDKVVCVEEYLYNYNKKFSKITGTDTVNLKKMDWYFESILTSISPYFESEFLEILRKWNAPLPGVVHANLSNYLRSVDASVAQFSLAERSSISTKVKRLMTRLEAMVPADFTSGFFGEVYQLRNFGRFKYADVFGLHATLARVETWYGAFEKSLLGLLEANLSFIDRHVPKRNDIWVFSSWGHYERHTMDSPRAVYELVKKDKTIKKIVLMNGQFVRSPVAFEGKNAEFHRLNSVKGLYYLVRAGRIFTAYSLHNLFGYRKLENLSARKIVQLWHGIPIKKVGLQVPRRLEPFWEREARRYHFVPSSSECDRQIMAASFAPEAPAKVGLTGLPRHDFLAMADDELPADYREHLHCVRSRLAGRRLILFAPTWRYKEESPCALSAGQLMVVDRLLKSYDAVLGVRLHRNMMKAPRSGSLISDNVIHINDIPDINILFRECAAVVTDYSSLYLDYMKLRRPVILYTPDVDTYANNRGFNYKPSQFLPHDFQVRSFEMLLEKLSLLLSGQHQIDHRFEEVLSRFHSYGLDALSASRVLEALK